MTIETNYPTLRAVMDEQFAYYDDTAFVNAIQEHFPGLDVDELEFSFKKLGNQIVAAAPGALSGALSGATMGAALGPYGMLAGAAIGAVGGGIANHQQNRAAARQRQQQARAQRPRTTPTRPTPASPTRPPATPVGATPTPHPSPQPLAPVGASPTPHPSPQPALPAGMAQPVTSTQPSGPIMGGVLSPQQIAAIGTTVSTSTPPQASPLTQQAPRANAAGQVLQLLSRPEVLQALMALSVGILGRRQVQVGEYLVAPEQVLDLIEMTASESSYFTQSEGSSLGEADPYDLAGFSAALLAEMALSPAESHPFYQEMLAISGDSAAALDVGSDHHDQETYAAFGY